MLVQRSSGVCVCDRYPVNGDHGSDYKSSHHTSASMAINYYRSIMIVIFNTVSSSPLPEQLITLDRVDPPAFFLTGLYFVLP
jgi:hypothetical protein